MKWIILLIFSLLSGFLYYAGGHGKPFNTKYRDWGIPLLSTILSYLYITTNLIVLGISFLLTWGALSTYWKKSADVEFKHFYFHGLALGFSLLPCIIVSHQWIPFSIRLIVLPLLIAFWSTKIDDVFFEDTGKGFLIMISMGVF